MSLFSDTVQNRIDSETFVMISGEPGIAFSPVYDSVTFLQVETVLTNFYFMYQKCNKLYKTSAVYIKIF